MGDIRRSGVRKRGGPAGGHDSRRGGRTTGSAADGRRGQSSVLGVVLLLGLVIAGTSVIVVVGGAALGETEGELSNARAQKVMTQFDSQTALVALGETNSRQTRLVTGEDGRYNLDSDSGWMNVTVENTTSGNVLPVTNVSLGALVYDTGDARIAYQGGGVWQKGNGAAVMVSPPEFHYRSRTLTLPIINVTGEDAVNGRVQITRAGITKQFPDRATNTDFVNPVPIERKVVVTVGSEYYRGWGSYFERRTDGNVTYDDANQTVSIELTVPIAEDFDNAVTATGTVDGSAVDGTYVEGVSRPSVTDTINDKISACGGTNNVSSTTMGTLTAGTYCNDGNVSFEGATFDTSSGDIDVIIDGNATFQNSDTDITGDGNVTLWTKGLQVNGDTKVNDGGDAGQLLTYIHSGVDEFDVNGNALYVGLIYAPHSDYDINGGGNRDNVVGSVVVNDLVGNGNPATVTEAGEIDRQLEFVDNVGITYLHISENEVEITDS